MKWLLAVWIVLAGGVAHCEDARMRPAIIGVLERSQQKQLDAMTPADDSAQGARTVRASFDRLLGVLGHPELMNVELRVVQGDVVAETLHGRIVVANASLGDLPEAERIFVLAHELGHVALGHWLQMGLLYAKWIPGAVEQKHTDAVDEHLGRDASALAYRQEFEADAFALQTLLALGLKDRDATAAFMHLGRRDDTATHPGTRKRLAALRARAGG